MAIQRINYGAAPDDGTGDPLRVAFKKSDDNFVDLDSRKAEQSDVATALALKADTTTVNTALALKADTTTVNTALALKADQTAVEQAIAMAATFAAVPATFQAPVIIVTTPHFRLMQWNGTKYVRSPLGKMPGEYFYAHDPLGQRTDALQVRTDVTYNTADHPDLAEYLGVVGSTFVLPGDGRARVLRGADLGAGIDAALVDGYMQGDAGRNLTGQTSRAYFAGTNETSGAFQAVFYANQPVGGANTVSTYGYSLDASRQWPVATEFRVKSLVARLYMTR